MTVASGLGFAEMSKAENRLAFAHCAQPAPWRRAASTCPLVMNASTVPKYEPGAPHAATKRLFTRAGDTALLGWPTPPECAISVSLSLLIDLKLQTAFADMRRHRNFEDTSLSRAVLLARNNFRIAPHASTIGYLRKFTPRVVSVLQSHPDSVEVLNRIRH